MAKTGAWVHGKWIKIGKHGKPQNSSGKKYWDWNNEQKKGGGKVKVDWACGASDEGADPN